MIFPFKITNTNTNPNTNINTEIINTNTNSHDWDELNPKKKRERTRWSEAIRPWEGSWARPWEGSWLAKYRCEIGEGYGKWVREIRGLCELGEDKTEMRESKNCAWLLVTMWVRELRDEEGEVACEWES